MKLELCPLTIAQANALVASTHRHHKPVVSHRFSIGIVDATGALRGAAIVGRPVARGCETYRTAEVTRLVTDGVKNGCSMLYAATARAAAAMGFDKIQTYILATESGVSLVAAGWSAVATTAGGEWNGPRLGTRRVDQPMCGKKRYEKVFRARALIVPADSLANASDSIANAARRMVIADDADLFNHGD